ncbi:uncharacterized protein DSM5745_03980 [Aspergillus mulundensis]|uniref:Uncharacterized protein n=1 Tax=Aspergillus mulundensis TaxID=1810919 RepID=A0A3D8SC41_9EURO|nr:hypothetical protein DSM5745_03980 [Aspergillus mulundensis]RDW83654.1 hypothetical protein DSM5745_03980 [Aspergillus mulundensis]
MAPKRPNSKACADPLGSRQTLDQPAVPAQSSAEVNEPSDVGFRNICGQPDSDDALLIEEAYYSAAGNI